MKKIIFILIVLPFFVFGQSHIYNEKILSSKGEFRLKQDTAQYLMWVYAQGESYPNVVKATYKEVEVFLLMPNLTYSIKLRYCDLDLKKMAADIPILNFIGYSHGGYNLIFNSESDRDLIVKEVVDYIILNKKCD